MKATTTKPHLYYESHGIFWPQSNSYATAHSTGIPAYSIGSMHCWKFNTGRCKEKTLNDCLLSNFRRCYSLNKCETLAAMGSTLLSLECFRLFGILYYLQTCRCIAQHGHLNSISPPLVPQHESHNNHASTLSHTVFSDHNLIAMQQHISMQASLLLNLCTVGSSTQAGAKRRC